VIAQTAIASTATIILCALNSVMPLSSPLLLGEDTIVEAVVISELEFGDVQRR
jgi:hypothetical protein